MTPPKKWPERAEWARVDTLAALDTIRLRARDAQRMISQGQGLQAMYLLTQIADHATRAREQLQQVKGAR